MLLKAFKPWIAQNTNLSTLLIEVTWAASIKIWKKLPNELVQKGAEDGWLKIKKSCTISITKGLKNKKGIKKATKTPIQDGFTIQ